VLAAFTAVPRHVFVPDQLQPLAYGDGPLALGWGQTISQPYMVGFMTEKLWTTGAHAKILEIGTGAGYQTAILAQLGVQVFTIDILPQLTRDAERRLQLLGLHERVAFKSGDGFTGWPEAGPFDAVLIACAVPKIPEPLRSQLNPGGRVLAPVGQDLVRQILTLATPTPGGWQLEAVMPVVFVPMTGPHGLQL
jgi:protein-L-isoaspartate(D-aspartate) O-methyltransferase